MIKDKSYDLKIKVNIGSAIIIYANAKVKKILPTVRTWRLRIKTRSDLRKKLDSRDIAMIEKDVGLAPGTLESEAYKPFWKA